MIYSQNHQYFYENKNNKHYLSNSNGGSIEVDKLLADVWKSCSNKPFEEIYSQINQEHAVSTYLLQFILDLFQKADLLSTEKEQPRKTESEISFSPPLVSVIILNHNGKDHLEACFTSIINQNYPDTEIIMVDNGSSDGSVELVKEKFPQVKVVQLKSNQGFADGNNRGIRQAEGNYLFILNNDTELDKNCILEMVKVAESKPDAAAIAPKMKMFYLRNFLNSMGNTVEPAGWGSDNFIGYLDWGQFDHYNEVFSACFGAVLLPKKVVDQVGLLDKQYSFYYEDTDWCYRARLQGFKIYTAPQSVVYHKFSATMGAMPPRKLRLVVRNRLRYTWKNLSLKRALRFTLNYLKEDIRHFLSSIKHARFPETFAYFRAWFGFVVFFPQTLYLRFRTQRTRKKDVTDHDIFKLSEGIPAPQIDGSCPIVTTANIRRYYMHFEPVHRGLTPLVTDVA